MASRSEKLISIKGEMNTPIIYLALAMTATGLYLGQGCSDKKVSKDYLLRSKIQVMTTSEFNQAVDAAGMEAFLGVKTVDETALKDLRIRVLNQATEEMIISALAADKAIQVTSEEVDKAVAAVKADYPDNTFEEILLENAVSFQYWKKRLAARMLMEKVISKELIQQVQISSEDIAQYYKTNYPQGIPENEQPNAINQKIINHLRRQKAERVYKEWIEALRQSYPVEINQAAWNQLIDRKK
jgi:hypothetical protein